MQTKLLPFYLLIASVILTAICYFPGLTGSYVLDDFENIVHNEELDIDQINSASIAQAAFAHSASIFGRPVSMVSFALNKYYFGNNPYSYKVTNLCIHLANGVLIFIFSYLLLIAVNDKNKSATLKIKPQWFALIISAVWLIHPINTTGVLYVVQRMTSLATLFSLLSIICYLLLRLRMFRTGKISVSFILLSIVFFIMALLSKESGALIFVFISLIEIILLQFSSKEIKYDKRLIAFYSLALISALFAAITWIGPNPLVIASWYEFRYFTLGERLLTELRVVTSYIKWICIPNIQELSLYHDDVSISTSLFSPITTFLSLAFITTLLSAAFLLRTVAPLVSFGIAFFFAGHLLESTVFPLEFAFEHRNYLPSVGILIALLSALGCKYKFNIKIIFGIFIVFSLLCATTYIRSDKWSNPFTFADYSATNKVNSARAQLARANIYLKLIAAGEFANKQAVTEYFNAAVVADKFNIGADLSRLMAAHTLEIEIPNKWLENINHKLQRYPLSIASVTSLKHFTSHVNKYPEHFNKTQTDHLFESVFASKDLAKLTSIQAKFLTVFSNYLSTDPNNYFLCYQLSEDALALDPKNPRLIANLANISLVLGKFDEAKLLISRLDNNQSLISYSRRDVKNLKESYARLVNNK